MAEYRFDLNGGGLRAVIYVYARDAEVAAAKVRQFLAARVPVAVVDGSGVELALYVSSEIRPDMAEDVNGEVTQ